MQGLQQRRRRVREDSPPRPGAKVGRDLRLERRRSPRTAGSTFRRRSRTRARADGSRSSTAASRSRTTKLARSCPCDVLAPCAMELVAHGRERRREVTGEDRGRGRECPDDAGRRRHPRGRRRAGDPGHPRERRRGRRLVLRVGAGPPGALLDGGRGEPAAADGIVRAGLRRGPGSCTSLRAASPMRLAAYGIGVKRVAEASHDPRALSLTP